MSFVSIACGSSDRAVLRASDSHLPGLLGGESLPVEDVRFHEIQFTFTGNEYEVDRALNLIVVQKYRLALEPFFVTASSAAFPLPDGRYRMTLALLRPDRAEKPGSSYLTHVDQEIEVSSKKAVADVRLKFGPDILFAREALNRVAIRIAPAGVPPLSKAFTGYLPPGDGDFAVSFRSDAALSLDGLIESGRGKASVEKPSSLFARQKQWKVIDASGIGVSDEDAEAIVQNPTGNTAAKLCLSLYDASFVKKCAGNPAAYIAAKRFSFAASVSPPSSAGFPAQISSSQIQIEFSVTSGTAKDSDVGTGTEEIVDQNTVARYHGAHDVESESKERFSGAYGQSGGYAELAAGGNLFGVKAEAGLRTEGGYKNEVGTRSSKGSVNVSNGTDYVWTTGEKSYRTRESTKTTTRSRMAVVNSIVNMSVHELRLTFEAEVENCVGIRAKKRKDNQDLFLCSKNPSRKSLNEFYAYLTQMWRQPSALYSPKSAQNYPPTILIRGEKLYREFYSKLAGNLYRMELVPNKFLPRELVSRDFSFVQNQRFPGML